MPIFSNVDYSGKSIAANQMDVFMPEGRATGIGLLFIHGGGWGGGKRESWHAVAKHFADLGYSCASMSYRLTPGSQYPAQVEDARTAMAFWKGHAEEYRFRLEAVVTIGSSAGGYLAGMLALIDPQDPLGAPAGQIPLDTRPMASVLYCPVTDLALERNFVYAFMGGTPEEKPDLYREANPIERVKEAQLADFPLLVIQGDKDETTPLAMSTAFCEGVRRAGGNSELVVLEGVGHGFGYGTETAAQKAAIAHVERFLQTLG